MEQLLVAIICISIEGADVVFLASQSQPVWEWSIKVQRA